MFNDLDANEITIKDIEDFLMSDGSATSAEEEEVVTEQPEEEEGSPAAQLDETVEKSKVNETQAFAHRLKEETAKIKAREREEIAKSLGFQSYAELQKANEKKIIEEGGYDPEELAPIVDKVVQKRLSEEPMLKELEGYRQEQVNAWAQRELAELKELTGGKITKLEDVPKDVIELWKTKGSLKTSYLELKGEELIKETRAAVNGEQSKGSTSHLKSPSGTPPANELLTKRPFTEKEREIYKMFNPNVTDEQLSKMLKDK